ncbi:MAG: formylmethanofuran dehydrogenase subunit A, partial [Planctomycetes bacterium]|nr:formylmethanofuran dehydrogenase subunit A [Planctomycetota bacterium]
YLIKGGVVIVEEGDIRKTIDGKELVVRPTYDESISDYLKPLFEQYYTMSFENYPVEMHRIEGADIHQCE